MATVKAWQRARSTQSGSASNTAENSRSKAVRQLDLGEKTGVQLAMELGIKRDLLYRWRDDLQANGEVGAFRGPGRRWETRKARSPD